MYGRRRGRSTKMRLVPIDSTKNIVQFNTQVLTVAVGGVAFAVGVKPADLDETNIAKAAYVEEGAMIRGFAIGIRVFNESGVADSNSTVITLRKNEGGSLGVPTLANMNSLNTMAWKSKIFHVEQAITGSQVSGWPMAFPSIKIPKRFHKMNLGDQWELHIANNTGNSIRFCGTIIYKWYK